MSPQDVQLLVLEPSAIQVGSVTVHSPKLCPVAGIVSVSVAPQDVQLLVPVPSVVQVASVTVHSPKLCPVAGIASVSI